MIINYKNNLHFSKLSTYICSMENEIQALTAKILDRAEQAQKENKVVDLNSISISVILGEIAQLKTEVKELHKQIENLL